MRSEANGSGSAGNGDGLGRLPGEPRGGSASSLPPDPVIEAYKEGVDRDLIRAKLRLSVEERVEQLQALVTLAEEAQRERRARGS